MILEGIGAAPDKLVIANNEAVGGMFGYKLSPTMEAFLGVAALATGRSVALKYDWFQQQTYTGKRSPWWLKVKIGADEKGKLTALESDWSVDHGPYSELGDLLTIHGAENICGAYMVPNIRGEGRTVCTNHAWGSAFRAFGAPQSEFATEVLMDELAEKMGMDPLELRYANVLRPGDTTPTGNPPDVYALPGLIDMMRPLYKAALEKAKKESTPEKLRGVGISCGEYNCGAEGPDASEAWIELTKEGAIAYTCWEDPGQGGDVGTLVTCPRRTPAVRDQTGEHQAYHERHEPCPQQRTCRREPCPGHDRPGDKECLRPVARSDEESRWVIPDLRRDGGGADPGQVHRYVDRPRGVPEHRGRYAGGTSTPSTSGSSSWPR